MFVKETFLIDYYFEMYKDSYYSSLRNTKQNGGIYKVLLHTTVFGPVSFEHILYMFEDISAYFNVSFVKKPDYKGAYYHLLRRIVLKGLLKKTQHKKVSYYSITSKGFDYLFDYLIKKFPELASYKSYYKERLQNDKNMQQLAHNDTISKHYIYLVRTHPEAFEKVRLAFLVNEKGSIYSNNYFSNSQALKIDSLFYINNAAYLTDKITENFVDGRVVIKEPILTENDQSTENMLSIKEKLGKYVQYYLSSDIYKPYSTLLFTISGRTDYDRPDTIHLPSMNTFRIYKAVLDTMIYMNLYENKNMEFFFDMVTATTALSIFEQYKERLGGFERYQEAVFFYKKYVKLLQNKSMTYNAAMASYSDVVASSGEGLKTQDINDKLDKYIKRRNAIFKKVLENKLICEEMKKGFRVIFSSNLEPGFAFPFLFINVFALDALNRITEKICGTTLLPVTYEPLKELLLLDGDSIFFRNCFCYSFAGKNISIIVENISDDASGFYRIYSFIQSEGYFHNGIFLLLTDAYQTKLDILFEVAKVKRYSGNILYCTYNEFLEGIYHKWNFS